LRPEPPIDLNDPEVLNKPAVTQQDWELLKAFHEALEAEHKTECLRCNEAWFKQDLNNDFVCSRCIYVDQKKKEDEPYLFSDANHMDPVVIPEDLPELTQIEEMLVARVHPFVEIRQVRGHQYKYSGHIVNFLRDTAKVYNQLPLLPEELEIVMLKPENTSHNHRLELQFKKDFRVRRSAVTTWLKFLVANHPGYSDITLSEEVLGSLPEDGSVIDCVPTAHTERDVDPRHIANVSPPHRPVPTDEDILSGITSLNLDDFLDTTDETDFDSVEGLESLVEVSAVPDLAPKDTDLEALRGRLQVDYGYREPAVRADPARSVQGHIVMPRLHQTPLDEFNRSQKLLSLAFPTLYPQGKADFLEPRMRSVDYKVYIKHMLLYIDGRFARHPRFRYVAFNTLMRRQINTRSSFFVKHRPNDRLVDIEDLRQAFNNDDPEAQALLNSIVRYSGSLQGTRPFWNGKNHNLMSYVHQLGTPHLFQTVSAADFHWVPLMKQMPNYLRWRDAPTDRERIREARIALRDNPHIAAFHFYRRFELAFKLLIKPKFNVIEWWNRFEWQGRGSTHNHGIIWCAGGPTVDLEDSDSRRQWELDWGNVVSAMHPEPTRQFQHEDDDVLAAEAADQANTLDHLVRIVTRTQTHHHKQEYCLRKKKGAPADAGKECRFSYPRKLREQPALLTG
jgi:hypothetical protein